MRYRFRLIGYDTDWVDGGQRTAAVYTNLPPRDYRFEVQALLHPGDWQSALPLAPASLSFTVRPAFWQTTGFRIAVAFALALLASLAYRRRVARVRAAERALVLAASEKRYRELFEMSLGLICVHTLDGTLTEVNPAVSRLLGFDSSEMIGRKLAEVVPERHRDAVAAYLERVRSIGEDRGLLTLSARDGTARALQYHNKLYHDADVPYVIGHAQDVTDHVRQEATLQEQGLRDPLTGAYNRRYIAQFAARQGERGFGCIVFDLDHFKTINDTQGHQRGDEVLIETVKFLRSVVRPGDAVVRLGGDEFLVLLADSDPERVRHLAERVRAQAARRAPCAFSIGWTARDGHEDVETMLDRADQQLYAARRERRASPPAGRTH